MREIGLPTTHWNARLTCRYRVWNVRPHSLTSAPPFPAEGIYSDNRLSYTAPYMNIRSVLARHSHRDPVSLSNLARVLFHTHKMSPHRSAHRHLHPLPRAATATHTHGSTDFQPRTQPSPSAKPDYQDEPKSVALRRHAHVRRSPQSRHRAASPRGHTSSESSIQLSAFPRPPLQAISPSRRAEIDRLSRVCDREDLMAFEDEDEICAWVT